MGRPGEGWSQGSQNPTSGEGGGRDVNRERIILALWLCSGLSVTAEPALTASQLENRAIQKSEKYDFKGAIDDMGLALGREAPAGCSHQIGDKSHSCPRSFDSAGSALEGLFSSLQHPLSAGQYQTGPAILRPGGEASRQVQLLTPAQSPGTCSPAANTRKCPQPAQEQSNCYLCQLRRPPGPSRSWPSKIDVDELAQVPQEFVLNHVAAA